jgi:hypothetical protein
LDQLQHAAEQNVDKVTDLLSQEVRMLRMLLHRKIHEAKNHGSSTTFPDLHELHSKFLDDTSMLLGARRDAEVESIQFLFLDAQCMSKVVGVGLQHALVTVTNDNDVKVEHLSESTWEILLDLMFKDVKDQGDFELIGFKLPKMKVKSIQTMRLPAKEVKKFGGNLKDFHQDHIITREQSEMVFPLIWKVVELYRAFRCPEQASVGGSATDASSSGGRKVGNSQGDGDGEDDGEGGGSGPPEENRRFVEILRREVIQKFKVTIYPGLGGSFQGVHPIPEHMRTASIMSTLIVEFSQEITGAKFIHVTTQTQCNLGRNGNSRNYFGCFQDDVTISFGESDPAHGGTELLFFAASDLRENDGVLTTDTTSQTAVEARSSSNQVSTNSSGQLLIAGSGGQVQNSEGTTSSQERNFSRAHTQEIPNVQQIDGFNVHQRNFGNELIYNFCIPPVLRNSNDPERILRYRDTFTPKVVGKWSVPMRSNLDSAPFTFEVERVLFPIESGEVNFGTGRVQDYKLSMLINLKMSHLDALDGVEGIELRGPTLGLDGVIDVFRHWGQRIPIIPR